MIQKIDMYTVLCDNCGKDCNKGSEYAAWSDSSQAVEVAENSDWITEGDKHYCPDCVSHDDDDNLVLKQIEKI